MHERLFLQVDAIVADVNKQQQLERDRLRLAQVSMLSDITCLSARVAVYWHLREQRRELARKVAFLRLIEEVYHRVLMTNACDLSPPDHLTEIEEALKKYVPAIS
jgi:hypothetical protein